MTVVEVVKENRNILRHLEVEVAANVGHGPEEFSPTVTMFAHCAADVCQRLSAQVTDGGVMERNIIAAGHIHCHRTTYDVHLFSVFLTSTRTETCRQRRSLCGRRREFCKICVCGRRRRNKT